MVSISCYIWIGMVKLSVDSFLLLFEWYNGYLADLVDWMEFWNLDIHVECLS